MRLKFIEYIINGGVLRMQMRRDATREADRSFIAIFTRFSNLRGEERNDRSKYPRCMPLPPHRIRSIIHFAEISARVQFIQSDKRLNRETMLLFASEAARKIYALHARREIFNGNKLSRDGKVDSLIFPGMRLPRRIQWNRAEKGTESRAHLCHFT